LPRKKKKKWNHVRALMCIYEDHLGTDPLMSERQFVSHFRVSRARFMRLLHDVRNSGIPFYSGAKAANGTMGASLEARLLLPLKSIAYGVPPHTFQDYFQMSNTLCDDACRNFDKSIKQLYESEYLRLPTPSDLRGLNILHKHQHGANGMFGSLDCMHTYWKNCPKAWQGSYSGKEGKATIVLEAVADYHLWFWHASYGYAGTMNDLNILHMSPLLESLKNGAFIDLEKTVVPYIISEEEFHHMFILVDGIYPPYSRFVRSCPEPIGNREKKFSQWQESARKDVERAFGVFQAKFQAMARPILLHKLEEIALKVTSCMILHNMCVSDRIMGDVNMRYNPAYSVTGRAEEVEEVEQPDDLEEVQEKMSEKVNNRNPNNAQPVSTGIHHLPPDAIEALTDKARWEDLICVDQHNRLVSALMDLALN
jgi:hypothetical protein